MMRQLLLACTLAAAPALGETLLSGAIYFDSKNTLLEVQDLLKAGDTNGLALLLKGNHISDKVPKDLEVILLLSTPEGAVEFRFANDPTTYWTYARYITANASKPAANPSPPPLPVSGPKSTLPADLPSSLIASSELPSSDVATPPTPAPTATPTPTPTPKPRVVLVMPKQEPEEEDTDSRPPLRRKRHAPASDDEEGVPESAKVWHLVNGHWKWYDRRNLHEVRRAIPVYQTPTAAPVAPATGYATPVPVPRALPVGPPGPQ